MLKCRDVPERAELLFDGQLTFWQRFGLRVHLFICRDCRRYVRNLRTLLGALGKGAGAHPPIDDAQAKRICQHASHQD